MIFQHQITGIPSELPPAVDQTLARISLCQWEDVIMDTIYQAEAELLHYVSKASIEVFSGYPILNSALLYALKQGN